MVTPRTILIVDDDQDGAASLGLLLEICGHIPTVRYNGSAAIELLAKFRPDVAFIDLSMPDIDGYEVCRRIRSQPWGDEPFVFALTGWMHREDDAIAAGFDGCLLKPCSLEHLKALLADPRARSNRPHGERLGPLGIVPPRHDEAGEA